MKYRVMEDTFSTTLAYTKSPKTSKRTSFQDELQAAVSARSQRHKTEEMYSYSDEYDDDDDDDDILKDFLNSRPKKSGIKAGKSKPKTNYFKLSDEEDENVKPKKVSFMKTRRKSSPTQEEVSDQSKGWRDEGDKECNSGQSESFLSNGSSKPGSKESLTSERSQLESPFPLLSERSKERQNKTTGGESSDPQPGERSATQISSRGSNFDDEPPRPKPRQRTLRVDSSTGEESATGGEASQSRPTTSSMSIPLSSMDMASGTTSSGRKETSESVSLEGPPEEDRSISSKFSRYSSSAGEQRLDSACKSTDGSLSREWGVSEDSKEDNDQKYSTSFEEYQDDTVDGSHSERGSHAAENSLETRFKKEFGDIRPSSSRTQTSRKSQPVRPHTAESRYLGTLKVLDHKVCLQETHGDAADVLRATVYQEWLKNKKQQSKETLRIKREEEILKAEKKKQEELAKKQDAIVSFEAWKEKKTEVIKAKLKQSEEMMRKRQKEMDEKSEREETAKKQVFENWKKEQDELLKEKYRKEKQAEQKLKQKKREEDEERKKECHSAFSKWSDVKKEIIHEKVKLERRQIRIQKEEEKYEKEEKDRLALEMYEKWLRKKERQEKRERQERTIRAILQDEPPPPWSPPSKTVPFGK